MSRGRLKRVVKARQHQLDEAVARVGEEKQRLERLEEAQRSLNGQRRQRLQQAMAGDALSVADLEIMDATQQSVIEATKKHNASLDEARKEARNRHVQLRQVEVLQARYSERDKKETARREQKQQDEHSRKMRNAVLAVMLAAGTLGFDSGCKKPAPPPAAPKPKVEEPKEPAKVCGEEQFSDEELSLLKKLRQRSKALQDKEALIDRKQAQLQALKRQLDKAIAEIRADVDAKGAEKAAAKGKTKAKPAPVAPKLKDDTPPTQADLIQMVQRMNARAAGAMFAEMNPGTSARVLTRLTPQLAGKILAQLPAESAGAVAEQIEQKTGRRMKSRRPGARKEAEPDKPPEPAPTDASKATTSADAPKGAPAQKPAKGSKKEVDATKTAAKVKQKNDDKAEPMKKADDGAAVKRGDQAGGKKTRS